ncbi:MAG TPA: protein kinase, partial [Polyangia bacterium]
PGVGPGMAAAQAPVPSRPSGGFHATDPTPITRLQPGTLVGEFQVTDRIAEGGMGTVYSAVHPIIGKKVAIKVLSGKLAKNNNAIRRFVLEARAVNDIRHPGLVDIFSFGRLTDGRPYYVMEFLDGRSLGAVLRMHHRLSPIDTYPVFMDVGRVLVSVHQHGIVHRDLKPDNVILVPQGIDRAPKVKLVDFGLAKLLVRESNQAEDGPHTAVGVNVGTPHYMSPEQCRGGSVDARSDLYALGVMFYETVTGHLPIDGPTPVDIWQAHVEVIPRRPELLAPDEVSPELGSLIMKLLAKRPDRRPQNAAEFCQALETLAKAGRLGKHTTPPPDDGTTVQMLDLARALSTTPVSSELVLLDGAPAGAPVAPLGPSVAQPPAVALGAGAPRLPLRRPPKPESSAEDLSATFKEIPSIEPSDEQQGPAERSQEVAGLREVLGLHIEEPAFDANDPFQVSAMVVNLDTGKIDINPASSTAGPPAGTTAAVAPQVRRLARPIEERQYVPPLSAPRLSKVMSGPPSLSRAPSRLGLVARVATAAVFVAAAAAVYWLLR